MMQQLQRKPRQSSTKWIAHFGGSFNPVHNGHIAIGRTLLEQYGFDRIVFVPNGDLVVTGGL